MLEILFLSIAVLKGIYSLSIAAINVRKLLTGSVKLTDLSDEKLADLIRYHSILVTIEAIAAVVMVIPLLVGLEQMQYTLLGFFIWFAAGAVEDGSAILIHRWEQKKR